MSSAHAYLNALSDEEARLALARCCGAHRWVEGMLAARPFADQARLLASAERIFQQLSRDDYLEAFSHHPRIGEDMAELRARFASTSDWSSQEQGQVANADQEALAELATNNRRYFERFGYIFIVCASGKSAAEMLSLLTQRLHNQPEVELAIASSEQAKITRIRLEKLPT